MSIRSISPIRSSAVDHFHAREESHLAVFREQAIDDRRERRIGLRRDLEHGTMGRRGDLHQQRGNRIGREGLDARHQLVGDRAEREQIGARVDRLFQHLLRRHVMRRPEQLAFPRDLVRSEPRDPEVENLDGAGGRQHQIRRLDVAVHNRALVRVVQAVGDLREDRQIPRERHVDALPHEVGQRHAVEQLHHDVDVAGVFLQLVDRDDVGVIQAGGRARFDVETLAAFFAVDHRRDHLLERDGPIEHRIVGLVDQAHPALAEGRDDLVAPADHAAIRVCHGEADYRPVSDGALLVRINSRYPARPSRRRSCRGATPGRNTAAAPATPASAPRPW